MNRLSIISITVLLLGAFTTVASAQEGNCAPDRDRSVGECSPGATAPSVEGLLNVIQTGSAQRLMGTLEYGQQVECYACVPLLMERALTDDNARVREFSVWWMRHRPFARNMVFAFFKDTLQNDTDAVRRARAASALGEMLTRASVPYLGEAAQNDPDVDVRASAVRALGRTNSQLGNPILAAAMSDPDASVRLAAVQSINLVNAFREYDALVSVLGDTDVIVRREAALAVGQRRVEDAAPALAALLLGDEDPNVRRSAAWALGRIGTADARTALGDAALAEDNQNVLDAIQIAQQMR